MLCVICLILTIPAEAASTILPGCYDLSDYIHDITISGDTKTIRYDFSDIRYAFRYWDNDGLAIKDFVDNATVDIGGYASEVAVSCYPFGIVPSGGALTARGGALYVGDLLPGSPIDFNFSLELSFSWENDGQPFDLIVKYEPGYYVYDELGNLIDTVNLDMTSVTYPLGVTLELTDFQELSGTIPASASYVMPFVRVRSYIIGQEQVWVHISFQGLHTGLSVDLSTVLENSNQMQAIKDKLDDLNSSIGNVGDKIDGTNDRLDQIISGGDAGDSLGSAGNKLEGSSGVVSDKADSVVGDIGSVGNFESGLMSDINNTIGKIDVAKSVGKFNTSLAFISNYAQLIFDGVDEWQVALTLPLFLGLFFGICQHVGGVANMRARQAREARNEELHQARLEKIQKGGSK